MLRSLKLLLCVGVLAAGGAVAVAAPRSPDQRAQGVTVCPLQSGQTSQPCCGPPVANPSGNPCCVSCCVPASTTAVQPACVPLTVSSSPNPSTAGRNVTISGRWSAGTAGVTVVLWQKLPGSATFQQVAQTTTGSLGEFEFVRPALKIDRKWYVTAAGDTSVTIEQQVHAVVTLSVSGLDAHGHVTPNHAGEQVLLEQDTSGGWKVIARPHLSHGSAYSVTLPASGPFDLRAVLPGDRRNMRSVSRVVGGAA